MKLMFAAAPILAAFAFATPGTAQTTVKTEVKNDTDVKDGVVTQKRTVVQETKRKTRQPKKILGVKVGHKTAVKKTVRETTTSSNGDASTTVKTTN